MAKIMVVEDDEMINQVITEFLKEKKHQVISVANGEDGLNMFQSNEFDLILLDIMLPAISGIDLLKEIRKTSNIPVIMLTAVDDEYTQLVSFNHLISDYVVKPFSPVILMKRVENVLRGNENTQIMTINELAINFSDFEVKYQDELVSLTKKEFEILAVLCKRKNSLVTREQLIYQVWGYDDYLDSRILDNHMKNLRKKLPYLYLKTIKGIGYKLEVEP